jgi:hypothetical protein
MNALRLADKPNGEPALLQPDVTHLRQALRGELVTPGDPGYDQARKVWNGMVDRRPVAVFVPAQTTSPPPSHSPDREICSSPFVPAATTLPAAQSATLAW